MHRQLSARMLMGGVISPDLMNLYRLRDLLQEPMLKNDHYSNIGHVAHFAGEGVERPGSLPNDNDPDLLSGLSRIAWLELAQADAHRYTAYSPSQIRHHCASNQGTTWRQLYATACWAMVESSWFVIMAGGSVSSKIGSDCRSLIAQRARRTSEVVEP